MYKRMLQIYVPEEVKEMRKREYKECKEQVKMIVRENIRRVDSEFGWKLCEIVRMRSYSRGR